MLGTDWDVDNCGGEAEIGPRSRGGGDREAEEGVRGETDYSGGTIMSL